MVPYARAPLTAVLPPAGPAGAASPPGLAAIPARYLTWYREAARTCPGLSWEVLAGIGTMESNNGRSSARGVHKGKNRKGAEGPMQFEPATFAEYAVRADPPARSPLTTPRTRSSPPPGCCAPTAPRAGTPGLQRAIFAYNHACWYVSDVLAIAARYTAAARPRHRAEKHPPRHHTAQHSPPHRHLTAQATPQRKHSAEQASPPRKPLRRASTSAAKAPPMAGATAARHRGAGKAGRQASARLTARRTGMVGLMVLAQRKVLLLAADDFEDIELLYPLYRLGEEESR